MCSIRLDELRANKVRNSLCQSLYENVFRHIVDLANKNVVDTSPKTFSTLLHINLLDIAGFGNFLTFNKKYLPQHSQYYFLQLLESFNRNNHFEQLCINFVNEKIQQMFVKMMLKKEEEWYAIENLEVPKIQFFDNNPILGNQ